MQRPLLTPMQLGRMLQTARKARQMSQADVGARLDLSQKRISALELDPGSITVEQLLKLCAVVGLELAIGPKGGQSPDAATKVEW
jgi:HTH-type transcriptional regulator/antitoxin HipB